MKILATLIMGFILVSCYPEDGTWRRLQGVPAHQIAEERNQALCATNCDESYRNNYCNNKENNALDRFFACKVFNPKRCPKECYIPYCTCQTKEGEPFHAMCKSWCNGNNAKNNAGDTNNALPNNKPQADGSIEKKV